MKRLFFALLPIALILAYISSQCSDSKPREEQAIQQPIVSDDSLLALIRSMPDNKPQLATLNDVPDVLDKLSAVGIGSMRTWKDNGRGYMSSTPFYSFGSESSQNGMQNNLAFYVESPSEQYVKQVKLMLNINNGSEAVAARSRYATTSIATLVKLGIPAPKKLKQALSGGHPFTQDTKDVSIVNEVHNDRIDWYKLVVTAK
jgi:hypothetical protein